MWSHKLTGFPIQNFETEWNWGLPMGPILAICCSLMRAIFRPPGQASSWWQDTFSFGSSAASYRLSSPKKRLRHFFPISMISMFFQVKSANLYDLSPTLISAGVGKKRRIFMEFPHVLNVLTRLLDWNGAQIMCGLGMSLAQSSATWAVKMHPPHYHHKFQLRLWQNEKGCRNGRKLTYKHQTNLNRSFTGGIFISILCKFSCRTFCCWVSLSQSYPNEHLHQRRKSTIFWTTLPRSQAHPHNNSPLMAWRPQIFKLGS